MASNVRDWLFVHDHCRALERILLAGEPGRTYCIGGSNEVANLDLVRMLCDLMEELAPELPVRPCRELIRFVADRPGHDRRYAIDASRIRRGTGLAAPGDGAGGPAPHSAVVPGHRAWWEPLLSAGVQRLPGVPVRVACLPDRSTPFLCMQIVPQSIPEVLLL